MKKNTTAHFPVLIKTPAIAAPPPAPAPREDQWADPDWKRLGPWSKDSQPETRPSHPTLAELLPPDYIGKLLELRQLTGINVAFWSLHYLINEVADSDRNIPKELLALMEAGWLQQIEQCRIRWKARATAEAPKAAQPEGGDKAS